VVGVRARGELAVVAFAVLPRPALSPSHRRPSQQSTRTPSTSEAPMTGSACIPGSVSSLYGQHMAGRMHEVASAGRRLAVNPPSRMALTPSCPSERASYAPTQATLQHMERRWAKLLAVVCSPFTNHYSTYLSHNFTLAASGLPDSESATGFQQQCSRGEPDEYQDHYYCRP